MQVLSRLRNRSTRAMYGKGLSDFLAWWRGKGQPALSKLVVQAHRASLERRGYSASTINQRLAAIRRLTVEAGEIGLVRPEDIIAIGRLKGVARRVVRHGTWLTAEQSEALINAPDPHAPKGKRDRALLAMILGCGLRRSEVASIDVNGLQHREGRWVLLNVRGKHGRARTVPVPPWVKEAVDQWVEAGGVVAGAVFRSCGRDGSVSERAISGQTVFQIVAGHGRKAGLRVTPEDLRRTCARLCSRDGGDIEQLQLLLGHSRIHVTERYLSTGQNLARAPNDTLGLRWHRPRNVAS